MSYFEKKALLDYRDLDKAFQTTMEASHCSFECAIFIVRNQLEEYNNATAKKWKDKWKKMVNQLEKSSSQSREADVSLLPSVKKQQKVLRSATTAPSAYTSTATTSPVASTTAANALMLWQNRHNCLYKIKAFFDR
ncbi:hypothetical protein HMPREF1544_07071 [Mucor circinelloides 1006PhL]|uniref:Uncharacterized protein n=1 Tax=Mucor circinelloides f. circinelloides (strain 1006PhL) TaxID=1220926 RepID=S2J939_MUCC1|nr:hypothetical protein HMPREF1544_07071 [Mucor circinelloides 1006PhL]